jgi:hypothetical protein
MKRMLWLSGLLVAAWSVGSVAAAAQPITTETLLTGLYDLHALPLLTPAETWQDSSYDRGGGNGDAGNFLETGPDDFKVLADVQGPGCIARMWSANPGGRLRIYFDDEPNPRVDCDFQAFFKDQVPPFASPITGTSSGGWYSYMPLPFAKRCRITVQGGGGFYYQVTYQKYPAGTPVITFNPKLSPGAQHQLDAAESYWRDLVAGAKEPPLVRVHSALMGKLRGETRVAKEVVIAPGKRAVIWQDRGAGCVRALRMTVSGADPQVLRRTILRGYWDDQWTACVESPIADFFGCGFGDVKYTSLPLGNTDQGYYCYWPMPYGTSGKLDIENRSTAPAKIAYSVDYDSLASLAPNVGRFHAQWNQEVTEARIPYHLLRATGRGKFCGVTMSMKGTHGIGFLEGDEMIYVDGQKRFNGTGTEDYFNCGWYFNAGIVHRPLHGLTVKNNDESEISAYRWQIPDCVDFDHDIVVNIEHGGNNDYPGALYSSVAYWYQLEPHEKFYKIPADMKLGFPARMVRLPEGVASAVKILAPGQQDVQRTTWEALGGNYTGPELVLLPKTGSQATFQVQVPEGDRYQVVAYGAGGPDAGKLALADQPAEAGDFHRTAGGPVAIPIGTVSLDAGEHQLAVRVVGQHPQAIGSAVALYGISLRSASPFIKRWLVIGPFPNPNDKGHNKVYPPEEEGIKAEANYTGAAGQVHWRQADAGADGILDLAALMKPNQDVDGYAATYIISPTARHTEILLGSDDGVKVWVNGKLVHDSPEQRGIAVDQDRFPIELNKGVNTLLVKVDQGPGDWKLSVRVRDRAGDLRFSLKPE